MTKVSLNNSPTEQLVAKAQASAQITDARGRSITLKKPGVLAQFRLIEALGDTSKNEVYMVIPPTRKGEVEALILRLDEDGIAAVQAAVLEKFGASTPEQDKAALKN